jgi:hypothetical protein
MTTIDLAALNRIFAQFLLVSYAFELVASCGIKTEVQKEMEFRDFLPFVRNDLVKFATTRPPGSQFTTLERRVVITNPRELVELSSIGDIRVLDELVGLLKDQDRAWAAMVLLAALTRKEEKVVDAFATTPWEWWESIGKTAHARWSEWLAKSREKLAWDSENRTFVEQQ